MINSNPLDENADPITKYAHGSPADPLYSADIITNLINLAVKPDEKEIQPCSVISKIIYQR